MLRNFDYRRANNIAGWLVFTFALLIYVLTVEETASFWDCGEFISVSYKLEVPHPPGAPFFLLMGRLFSFFALGNVEKVALAVNMLAVLSSAFTILFVFWSINLLAIKVVRKGKVVTSDEGLKILGCGLIGALAYTFSDSFWFSAVEAEVYATSSFLTAFNFWAMLKWENLKDLTKANRWLLVIFYTIGISIGVHLLNLTIIPALAVIYYFRNSKKASLRGILIYFSAGILIVAFIMYGLITGFPSAAAKLEVYFVNALGLPFGSGATFFAFLIFSIMIFALYRTYKKHQVLVHTFLLGTTFVLIGYCSYLIIPIRSAYDTPIDENDPEDVMTFLSYLKREQYGDRPLLYGRTFDARRVDVNIGAPLYKKGANRYEEYGNDMEPVYDRSKKILLPRIYSRQEGHPDLYRQWIGLRKNESPNMADNLYYLFRYQFGHMYFRYFLWNFSGRESDLKDANALTVFDLGDDPPHEIKTNKARKKFLMLPLLLGVMGILFQYKRDKKSFLIVSLLFTLTGLGLVLYLNSPPVEPRERDYIYTISYSAFCMWIGFGFLAICEFLKKFLPPIRQRIIIAFALALTIPVLMGVQGWDSHDRSNRFYSVDQAKSMLESCAPNAILFTGGDNDTFPLWYLQEVEGFRTDIRVVVLSYFATNWYIEQMRRPAYKSEPLDFELTANNYGIGNNEYIPLINEEKKGSAVNLKKYIQLVKKENEAVYVTLQDNTKTAILLSDMFYLDVDSAAIAAKGIVPEDKQKYIAKRLYLPLNENAGYMMKSDLAILDLIATTNWERPIYFNMTSANTTYIDLKNYLHLEGLVYRFMPVFAQDIDDIDITSSDAQSEILDKNPFQIDSIDVVSNVNAEVMLENLKKFEGNFRGMDDESVYYPDEYRRFVANTRNSIYKLAKELLRQGRKEEAKQVMDYILTKLPDKTVPFSFYAPKYIEVYTQAGDHETALSITDLLTKRAKKTLQYFAARQMANNYLVQKNALIINQLGNVMSQAEEALLADSLNLKANDEKYAEAYAEKYEEIFGLFKDYMTKLRFLREQ